MSVQAVEACRSVDLYGYGDVKTMTLRYPVKELQAACGAEPGSWCVMTSTVADLKVTLTLTLTLTLI